MRARKSTASSKALSGLIPAGFRRSKSAGSRPGTARGPLGPRANPPLLAAESLCHRAASSRSNGCSERTASANSRSCRRENVWPSVLSAARRLRDPSWLNLGAEPRRDHAMVCTGKLASRLVGAGHRAVSRLPGGHPQSWLPARGQKSRPAIHRVVHRQRTPRSWQSRSCFRRSR